MLNNQIEKRLVAVRPFVELCFDSTNHRSDIREIFVVDAKLSGEFPYSFCWIEIRAVWWEVIKAKLRFVFLTPSFVEVWRGGISRCQ
jgi:hypothetical protein